VTRCGERVERFGVGVVVGVVQVKLVPLDVPVAGVPRSGHLVADPLTPGGHYSGAGESPVERHYLLGLPRCCRIRSPSRGFFFGATA